MYAYIQGEVTEIYTDRAVVEAAGVGYELLASANTLSMLKKGSRARLLTHMHITSDNMQLYGFYEDAERDMFRRLISVTRVGPKLAIAVLSRLSAADVALAILTENEAMLSRVPGMGKKTAQRVLLELKGKVDAQEQPGVSLPQSAAVSDMRSEAMAALISLGYDNATATRAVGAIKEAAGVEDLITAALRMLAKR